MLLDGARVLAQRRHRGRRRTGRPVDALIVGALSSHHIDAASTREPITDECVGGACRAAGTARCSRDVGIRRKRLRGVGWALDIDGETRGCGLHQLRWRSAVAPLCDTHDRRGHRGAWLRPLCDDPLGNNDVWLVRRPRTPPNAAPAPPSHHTRQSHEQQRSKPHTDADADAADAEAAGWLIRPATSRVLGDSASRRWRGGVGWRRWRQSWA